MNVRMTYSSCSRWCRSSLCKSRMPRSCRFQLENKMKVSFTVSASDKQSTTTMRRNVHTYSWSIHKGPCSQLMSLVFVWSCCVSGLSWVSVVWCSDKGQSFYSVLGTTGPGANCACHAAARRHVVDDHKEGCAHDFLVHPGAGAERWLPGCYIRPQFTPDDSKPRILNVFTWR